MHRNKSTENVSSTSAQEDEKDECICGICLESLTNQDKTAVGACMHKFHKECIVLALEAQYHLKNAQPQQNTNPDLSDASTTVWEQGKPQLSYPTCRGKITNPTVLDSVRESLKKSLPKEKLLLDAVLEGRVNDVVELLKKVNPGAVKSNHNNNTLLHLVKNLEITRLLIAWFSTDPNTDLKAMLNAPNGQLWTSLHMAASEGNVEITELLIDAGVDLDRGNDWGWGALHLAAQNGHIETIKLLIRRGANKNAKANLGFTMQNGGITPLHVAALFGNAAVLKLLLELGADKDAEAICKLPSLQIAALFVNENFRARIPNLPESPEADYQACITLLKKAGANTEAKNDFGLSYEQLQVAIDFPPVLLDLVNQVYANR